MILDLVPHRPRRHNQNSHDLIRSILDEVSLARAGYKAYEVPDAQLRVAVSQVNRRFSLENEEHLFLLRMCVRRRRAPAWGNDLVMGEHALESQEISYHG
jgi:hypothetical protein